jgi:hypothetical protein
MTTTDTTGHAPVELDAPIPYMLREYLSQPAAAHASDEAQDDAGIDLPLEALADVAVEAVALAGTLIDSLPQLRVRTPSSPETYAYDVHQRRAYLDAEAKAQEAWNALAHALQLIKGLAR